MAALRFHRECGAQSCEGKGWMAIGALPLGRRLAAPTLSHAWVRVRRIFLLASRHGFFAQVSDGPSQQDRKDERKVVNTGITPPVVTKTFKVNSSRSGSTQSQ